MSTSRGRLTGEDVNDISASRAPFSLSAFLMGIIAAGLVILVLALLQGLVLALTSWPPLGDGWLRLLNLIAIGVGAIVAGRRAWRFGWLHGLGVGILYAILVAWWVGYGLHILHPPLLTWLILALVVGALGGMLGSASRAASDGGGRWR